MKTDATVKLLQDKGKTYIRAIAVLDKYVPKEAVPKIAQYGVNQPILYRHIHPSNDGQILGTVLESKAVEVGSDNGVEIYAEMLEHTDYQKKAVEYIKAKQDAGDPIKISVGYQEFKQGEKLVDARPFEFSLTRIPVCDECSTTEVVTMEKDEARIKELEKLLDESVSKVKTLEAKIKEFESKDSTISKKLEDSINAAVATVRNEYDGKIKTITEQLENAKIEAKKAKYEPIIEKLKKLEDEQDLDYYGLPLDKLTKRLERLLAKAPPQIVTKTMEESRKEVAEETKQAEIRSKIRKSIAADPELAPYFNKVG